MAIPNNYIEKITKDNDSRYICPAADKVRVDNENYEGTDLDEVLDEVAEQIAENTPYIGENGNWYVEGLDTGIKAQGPKGDTIVGASTVIVNNVNDGGETSALSAEMGKVLRINLMAIYNALGVYAFPNGKPILNWGSTVIKHRITASLTSLTSGSISVDGSSVGSLPAQVEDGQSLSMTLVPSTNMYVIDDDNVSVTMGGADITSQAYDDSTGAISIAQVTGDVVITATGITYVSSGLVMHMDGLDKGNESGKWKSLVGSLEFTLSNCTENTDNVQFNGTTSKAESDSTLNVRYDEGTIEGLYDFSASNYPTERPQIVLMTGTNKGITLALSYNSEYTAAQYAIVGATSVSELIDDPYPHMYAQGIVPKAKTHVSLSLDKLMLNGVEETTGMDMNFKLSMGMDAGVTKMAIGYRHRTSRDSYSKGKVFCVRVYSRVLSDSERAQNYKVDKKRYNLS